MDITLNRVDSDKFPGTLKEIITQPKQYSSLNEGDPNKSSYDDPVSSIQSSAVNEKAWVKSASNAIKVSDGDKRGINKGAVLYYTIL